MLWRMGTRSLSITVRPQVVSPSGCYFLLTVTTGCGAVPDFDTPEYALFGSLSTRKWETNEGVAPFSYGINNATNATEYKNGTTIIRTLVDIVSKNGN